MKLINQTPLLALKAVIDLGLELDEPIAFRPAAPAAEASTAPAAEPTADRRAPSIGTGLDWQTARDRLIALRRAGESFTSLRDLAARVGCSEGLIDVSLGWLGLGPQLQHKHGSLDEKHTVGATGVEWKHILQDGTN